MSRHLPASPRVLVAALGLLAAAPAAGASLQPVQNWGAVGVPSTVSMYVYVPDKLATRPPILVCAHFCGGSAAAVFGEAQGGGLVQAADKYGFVMIFPQAVDDKGAGRCWAVGTNQALTRDGGGDTQAIAQMVQYAITRYGANPDRVYASGTSSGAMMTQVLLALYPDVFKAGVEFAGVPAGCWAAGDGANGGWSGPCAGGQVIHTAPEWGDIARRMFQGYAGHRPRIQLWHGDADTIIRFQNHLEAIKQWTNVLGLSATPTSKTTLSYGTHQWTRESWKDACGYTVLDAWTEHAGEHGVPDVNLNAQYTIPFLALDQAGATDPEIAQCEGGSSSSGGSSGSGSSGSGSSGSSGSSSSGGSSGSSSGSSGSSSSGSGSSGSGSSGSSSGGSSSGGSSSGGSSGSHDGEGSSGGASSGGGHGLRFAEGATGCGSAPWRGATTGADLALLALPAALWHLARRRSARGPAPAAGAICRIRHGAGGAGKRDRARAANA